MEKSSSIPCPAAGDVRLLSRTKIMIFCKFNVILSFVAYLSLLLSSEVEGTGSPILENLNCEPKYQLRIGWVT